MNILNSILNSMNNFGQNLSFKVFKLAFINSYLNIHLCHGYMVVLKNSDVINMHCIRFAFLKEN